MVKCCHNIFNATKISFWNEMWLVCQRLGLAERIGVPMPLLSAVVQVNDALERLVARERRRPATRSSSSSRATS